MICEDKRIHHQELVPLPHTCPRHRVRLGRRLHPCIMFRASLLSECRVCFTVVGIWSVRELLVKGRALIVSRARQGRTAREGERAKACWKAACFDGAGRLGHAPCPAR